MVNLNLDDHQEPPILKSMPDEQVETIVTVPLKCDLPCHNQVVERCIKIVSEAASQVTGFNQADGLIRQKVKS